MNDKSYTEANSVSAFASSESKKKFQIVFPYELRSGERSLALKFLVEDTARYNLKVLDSSVVGREEDLKRLTEENTIMFGIYFMGENGKEYHGKPFKV